MRAPFEPEVSLRFELRRADLAVAAGLCLTAAPAEALRQRRHAFLHEQELAALARMTVPKRAADYLRGRYACKRAIGALHPHAAPDALHIGAGVFRQPVLRAPNQFGLQVSISHSGELGAALAVEEGHPMALDVEQFDVERAQVIERALSGHERAVAARTGLPAVHALTMLWSMKEALSKVLKCGLTSPFHVLELAAVERAGAQLNGTFRHFTQYQAVAFALEQHACAIVLPRASRGLPVEALRAGFGARAA